MHKLAFSKVDTDVGNLAFVDLEEDQIIDNVNTLEESNAAIFSIKQRS